MSYKLTTQIGTCGELSTSDDPGYYQKKENTMSNEETKPASGLWRKNAETPEGKYLVKRRDGTVPEWPSFVLGAKDPAAPAALRTYALEARKHGFNEQYISDVWKLAREFEIYQQTHGEGDPDRGRHRKDDPETIKEMRGGHSS
jgi:hypothetical protein